MNINTPALSHTVTAAPATAPIRVMVVDDAIVVRSLVSHWVSETPDLEMVAVLRNGREAVNEIERVKPDVVVLDIDMPELDGISALPLLLQKKRDLAVIMASTLTRHNAEITLRALALGAADYIPKPENEGGVTTSVEFHRDLIEKIRALGTRYGRRAGISTPAHAPAARTQPTPHVHRQSRSQPASLAPESAALKLRPFPTTAPRVLLIGSSTGGPQALIEIMPQLQKVNDYAPILITQHMPPTFTIILAEHLSRACGRPVHEAIHGEPVLTGGIYLAPGGRHMRVTRHAGTAVVLLDDGPPINFCKPSVDPLFISAAEIWGNWTMALIMTGMGMDGSKGAAEIVAAGGGIIAQDEATSVIWGMPRAVAEAGLCSAVLPLNQIAPAALRCFRGGRP